MAGRPKKQVVGDEEIEFIDEATGLVTKGVVAIRKCNGDVRKIYVNLITKSVLLEMDYNDLKVKYNKALSVIKELNEKIDVMKLDIPDEEDKDNKDISDKQLSNILHDFIDSSMNNKTLVERLAIVASHRITDAVAVDCGARTLGGKNYASQEEVFKTAFNNVVTAHIDNYLDENKKGPKVPW